MFVSSSGKGGLEVFLPWNCIPIQTKRALRPFEILEVNLPSNFFLVTGLIIVYTPRLLQRRVGMVRNRNHETWCPTCLKVVRPRRCPQMQRLYVVPGGSLGAFVVCALKAAEVSMIQPWLKMSFWNGIYV